MRRIGIAGLGLMGGSLAKALKRAGYDDVTAVTRDGNALAAALSDGVISRGSADLESFADRDAVFICVPVDRVPGYIARLQGIVRADCLLTDVGSVKGAICRGAAELGAVNFVGGHPMCGSEKSGYHAAAETLYDGAVYVLTPTAGGAAGALAALVEKIGARPVIMTPEAHDKAVAAISHLPHALAAALTRAAGAAGALELAAGGFRDMTRIAAADPALWRAICLDNREALRGAIGAFQAELAAFDALLEREDAAGLEGYFAKAKELREIILVNPTVV